MSKNPSRQFYHTENCNRLIRHGGHQFAFQPYEMLGGTWCGIFATENPDEIKVLDELVNDKNSAVTSINAEEFELCSEKKARAARGNLNTSLVQPEPTPAPDVSASAVGGPGEPVETNPDAEPPASAPLENAEAAVTTAIVAAPAVGKPATRKPRKQS
jgi:hypothetical protein